MPEKMFQSDQDLVREIHEHFVKTLGQVPDNIKVLERYSVEALEGFYKLRRATMREPPDGALPKYVKELIITGIESALRFHGASSHAKAAIRAGATSYQVHETVVLALWLSGMTSYAAAGREAFLAADQLEKELKKKKLRK